MIAVAAIALGYLGIIAEFGWLGVAGVALHLGVLALGCWRPQS